VTASLTVATANAQTVSQRGFVDADGQAFPQTTPNDDHQVVGDVLVRQELFLRPVSWFQFDAGVDLRANSHEQVEDTWRLDWKDRGVLRPRLALRRLSATLVAGGFTLDVGKQLIRWGRADVIYPTDRFAPRDYLNVFDAELLAVTGGRASFQVGSETFEGVWLPRATPSRLPLFDQRWTIVPQSDPDLVVVDGGSQIPSASQYGVRWRHTGGQLETGVSFFDGLNHQPDIEVEFLSPSAVALTRIYPAIRMYGVDVAVPTSFVTWKLEGAYVTSPTTETEEYVLYVIEIERQVGEWLLDVGYAGDVTTREHARPQFNPDRGMARSVIGRAAYTVDPRRTLVFEGAVRQEGEGFFARAEYSQALGQFWRLTLGGVVIGGEETDFLGQYDKNSHVSVTLRFSY
jgi:hypothetical protein